MDDLIILSTHEVEGAIVHVCVRGGDVQLAKDVDQALTTQAFLRIVKAPPAK